MSFGCSSIGPAQTPHLQGSSSLGLTVSRRDRHRTTHKYAMQPYTHPPPAAPAPLGSQSSATKLRARHPAVARKLIPTPLPLARKNLTGSETNIPPMYIIHVCCPGGHVH
ncbi:hypothetical protein EYF80_002397 [Liparis tanakae]|uniref:Uncharacterized protein n=1 Tax=Liparis tanakae TaxID=230148 RepID=A0A4Z2JA23_9TELE|nr:hypothetical protein EYF80_002397 [Liparis tanakae]